MVNTQFKNSLHWDWLGKKRAKEEPFNTFLDYINKNTRAKSFLLQLSTHLNWYSKDLQEWSETWNILEIK